MLHTYTYNWLINSKAGLIKYFPITQTYRNIPRRFYNRSRYGTFTSLEVPACALYHLVKSELRLYCLLNYPWIFSYWWGPVHLTSEVYLSASTVTWGLPGRTRLKSWRALGCFRYCRMQSTLRKFKQHPGNRGLKTIQGDYFSPLPFYLKNILLLWRAEFILFSSPTCL